MAAKMGRWELLKMDEKTDPPTGHMAKPRAWGGYLLPYSASEWSWMFQKVPTQNAESQQP